MLDGTHFRELVIRPVLRHLGLHRDELEFQAAEELLLGTAVVESRLTYLRQIKGPALGLYQVEPATHDDILKNYLAYRPQLDEKVDGLTTVMHWPDNLSQEMQGNLLYATAIARLVYYRVPEALPAAGDLLWQAEYWKKHYNTYKGAGSIPMYVQAVQASGVFDGETHWKPLTTGV